MSNLQISHNIPKPYVVIQTTKPPYSTSAAIDALDAAMAATNIGLTIVFVFVDEGVYQLAQTQQSTLILHKSLYKKLCALPMFDVDYIYVHANSLSHSGVSVHNLPIPVIQISNADLISLSAHAQNVLVF